MKYILLFIFVFGNFSLNAEEPKFKDKGVIFNKVKERKTAFRELNQYCETKFLRECNEESKKGIKKCFKKFLKSWKGKCQFHLDYMNRYDGRKDMEEFLGKLEQLIIKNKKDLSPVFKQVEEVAEEWNQEEAPASD